MPSTRSRRERPAKPALSREWIIAATIKIMRTEGLEKATMRRVAQALDTGPASLYVYVANTAELHAAVLDELLDGVDAEGDGGWREQLLAVLRAYGDVLFTHPGLARSAMFQRPTGPNAIRLYDRVLGLLLDGGVELQRAAWGVDLLLQHVTGTAAEHSEPSPDAIAADADDASMTSLTRALNAADPDAAPHVAAHAGALLSGTPAQRMTWALQVLITGIVATPTGTPNLKD